MIVNIVDTKGDFKKSFENNENPTTIDDTVKSIANIEKGIGKKIHVILRNLRWSVKDLKHYTPLGVLDNEMKSLLEGEVLNVEISDL
jgi:hypothetical protein